MIHLFSFAVRSFLFFLCVCTVRTQVQVKTPPSGRSDHRLRRRGPWVGEVLSSPPPGSFFYRRGAHEHLSRLCRGDSKRGRVLLGLGGACHHPPPTAGLAHYFQPQKHPSRCLWTKLVFLLFCCKSVSPHSPFTKGSRKSPDKQRLSFYLPGVMLFQGLLEPISNRQRFSSNSRYPELPYAPWTPVPSPLDVD